MVKQYQYRIGFKTTIKSKWDHTFWKSPCNFGEIGQALIDFIKTYRQNVEAKELFFKIERKDY